MKLLDVSNNEKLKGRGRKNDEVAFPSFAAIEALSCAKLPCSRRRSTINVFGEVISRLHR